MLVKKYVFQSPSAWVEMLALLPAWAGPSKLSVSSNVSSSAKWRQGVTADLEQ